MYEASFKLQTFVASRKHHLLAIHAANSPHLCSFGLCGSTMTLKVFNGFNLLVNVGFFLKLKTDIFKNTKHLSASRYPTDSAGHHSRSGWTNKANCWKCQSSDEATCYENHSTQTDFGRKLVIFLIQHLPDLTKVLRFRLSIHSQWPTLVL